MLCDFSTVNIESVLKTVPFVSGSCVPKRKNICSVQPRRQKNTTSPVCKANVSLQYASSSHAGSKENNDERVAQGRERF